MYGDLGPNGDILITPAIVVQQGDALIDAVFPDGDDIAGLFFRRVQNDIHRGPDQIWAKFIHQGQQAFFAQSYGADLGCQVTLKVARMAHVRRQHLHQILA